MTEHIMLIGMMGAGKTTIGSRLAERLGWRHFDSDAQVQAHTGMTVPQIMAERGEPAFRVEEAKALAEGLGSDEPSVVSVAGGAVLDPANRELMRRSGKVVWLRADVGTLGHRVGTGEGRPLLGDDPPAALSRLYEQRRPVYEELADVVVDVDGLDPDQVTDKVLGALGR